MGLRETINANPAITGGIVVLLLVIVVFAVRGGGGTPYDTAYFYNLQTGELIALNSDKTPPTEAPDGGTAVRAHVFACGSCEGETFIAYLEQYTDEAKQLLTQVTSPEIDDEKRRELNAQISRGILIARPPEDGGDPEWQPMESPTSPQIVTYAQERCAGKQTVACMPDK